MNICFQWPEKAPKTQFSIPFIQGMLNRVAVGFFRYGDNNNKKNSTNKVKRLSVEQRIARVLDKYHKTGNTEFLIDVANYAMLEFLNPEKRDATFNPSDSDPTPSIAAYFHAKGQE